MAQVGYEIDKLLVDPIEYWAHRIVNGRRTTKWGPFDAEFQAQKACQDDITHHERPRLAVVEQEDYSDPDRP